MGYQFGIFVVKSGHTWDCVLVDKNIDKNIKCSLIVCKLSSHTIIRKVHLYTVFKLKFQDQMEQIQTYVNILYYVISSCQLCLIKSLKIYRPAIVGDAIHFWNVQSANKSTSVKVKVQCLAHVWCISHQNRHVCCSNKSCMSIVYTQLYSSVF